MVEAGKKYYINIEGVEHPWDAETIRVRDMRALANLPAGLSIVEEFPDGTERTLANTDVIALKPGHRYGRAPKFKRG
jgi:hypothetical protein